MIFKCKALRSITLIKENKNLQKDDVFELSEEDRLRTLVNADAIDILTITGDYKESKGKKVVVYADYMAGIGGIETALFCLAREFRDRNITFVLRKANIEQVLRVAQYRPVVFDDGKIEIKGDIVIMEGYNTYKFVKDRIKADKIYQRCHADWGTLNGIIKKAEITFYEDMNVLACSEQAKQGLLPIKSQCVPLIPPRKINSDFRLFLTLSRLSGEKGGKYIVRMAEAFQNANKSFLWLVCGTPDNALRLQCKKLPIIFIEPALKNELILKNADYLVQMSDSESYCYSVHTALANGVPCLCSDIRPFVDVIENGKNGYIIDRNNTKNMSENLIETIFSKVPKFDPVVEKVSPLWEKVLNGEI